VKPDDNVKVLFEEDYESYKIYLLVSKIRDDFANSLSFVSEPLSNIVQNMLK
jgi:hypothetical protein